MVGALNVGHILVLVVAVALIVLVVAALMATWRNRTFSRAEQIVVTILLVLLPGVGLIVWLAFWTTHRRVEPRR